MELIIIIAALIGAFWWITAAEKKSEESGRHPLDGNVTRKEPDLTTVQDGIGHQSVPVVIQALDVNKDGKVDAKDAKAAVDIVADNAKAVKATAEAVIKKPRKPKAATKKSADDRVE